VQGIPSIYYGTEQDLSGTIDSRPTYEGVREALWGKPNAFDQKNPTFLAIQTLGKLRAQEAALRYGRLYFRQVSGNRTDFGHSAGNGGILAYSRILAGREVLVVANTEGDPGQSPWRGFVVVDGDLNQRPQTYTVAFSNKGTTGAGSVQILNGAVFWDETGRAGAPARSAAIFVVLAPGEIQILTP
jgi:glycosidase